MMHAVMRRGVEQIFEPRRHAVYGLGMDPKLIEEVESLLRQNHRRRKAQESQGESTGIQVPTITLVQD